MNASWNPHLQAAARKLQMELLDSLRYPSLAYRRLLAALNNPTAPNMRAHLQARVDERLRLGRLAEQAVAQDERVPQLQLLEQAQRAADQPGRQQLLAQLLAQRRAQREARAERPPAQQGANCVMIGITFLRLINPSPDAGQACDSAPAGENDPGSTHGHLLSL